MMSSFLDTFVYFFAKDAGADPDQEAEGLSIDQDFPVEFYIEN